MPSASVPPFERAPERTFVMRRHRTTVRGLLFTLLLVGLAALPAAARSAADESTQVPQLVFPLVAKTTWWDNYGDPRGNGRHAGIDIMSPHRAPVVAVEAGRVKYWESGLGGCMLYLYGRSGTMYMYIHLNNDLTPKNDNRGRCEDVAYAVPNGAKVAAGEQIAWNGDSGDANGNPHLHFEVHPGGGADVNPYTYLKKARRPLFAAKPGTPFSLGLKGELVRGGLGTLELEVDEVRYYPGGTWLDIDRRTLQLEVPTEAEVAPSLSVVHAVAMRDAKSPVQVVAHTIKAKATLDAVLGTSGALTVGRVAPSR